ncbi:MAG: FAD-dependent oxidoreductase [Giesbergeria sp.]
MNLFPTRADALARLPAQTWDLVVIGGGISGAGVAQQAARRGWSVLLLEQRDFAWGTSSRSSKLVHGGLRYLKEGDLKTTLHSVRERQRLLHEAPGLVEPQSFLFADCPGRKPGRWLMQDRVMGVRPDGRAAKPLLRRLGHHAGLGAGPGTAGPARCPGVPGRQDRRRPPGLARAARSAARWRHAAQLHGR